MAKNIIPDNINKWLLDRLIAGKETKTDDKATIMWWFGLNQNQRHQVIVARESEKFADKYDKVIGSLSFVLLAIVGITIGRSYTTDIFLSILLLILVILIAIIVAAVIMLVSNKLLFNFKYNQLMRGNKDGQ